MSQQCFATCLFDLVYDPVPVPNAFQCHRCPFRKLAQEVPNGTSLMLHSHLFAASLIFFQDRKLRIVLVSIASYDITHFAAPFLFTISHTYSVAGGAAL